MLDVLLLLALPASGKSEIRRYLAHLSATEATRLGIGEQVHVDDYPYVHMMRRIAEEARRVGAPPVFFADSNSPFLEPRDWITLVHLIDEDIRRIDEPQGGGPAGMWLLGRFDRAGAAAGIDRRFADLPEVQLGPLVKAIDAEAAALRAGLPQLPHLAGATLIVEFARGGPAGSSPPLPHPFGFAHSLAALSPAILRRAALLHVAVSPAESRRRNRERARAGPEGDASILHHGVPETVMRDDYGVDDLGWMMAASSLPGFVEVATAGGTVPVPATEIDNEDDLTSHLRDAPADWDPEATAELHDRLAAALGRLAARR